MCITTCSGRCTVYIKPQDLEKCNKINHLKTKDSSVTGFTKVQWLVMPSSKSVISYSTYQGMTNNTLSENFKGFQSKQTTVISMKPY